MLNEVLFVGGTSSDNRAGLSVDLAVARALGVPARQWVTAVTAQDDQAVEEIVPIAPAAQFEVLARGPRPAVIKTGLLGSEAVIEAVVRFHQLTGARLIVDPVLAASSGRRFQDPAALRPLLERAELVTPNLPEATELRALSPKQTLLKGGHRIDDFCDDAWGEWRFRSPRQARPTRGTGCLLASAIAAGWASGLSTADALVQAKALLNRTLRLGAIPDWPSAAIPADLPWVPPTTATEFPGCGEALGFYPIVDRAAWLERLLPQGVTTVQLRIKDLRGEALRREIHRAVAIARAFDARLFINDYWELALAENAYGVHLGQGDLETADLPRLARAGMRVGISTHSYAEVARARGYRPSYIALGPIFPTTLKAMPYPPQGLASLARWRVLLDCQLVAIGGLTLEHAAVVRSAGIESVAVVSDITRHSDPEARARAWVNRFNVAG